MLVGLTGRIQSGKSTAAEMMVQRDNYAEYCLAEPMKFACQQLFDFTDAQLYDQDEKARVDEFWGLTPREVMQRIGTALTRDMFGFDILARRFHKWVDRHPVTPIVVSDVRFENQAREVVQRGGVVILIVRPELGDDISHESERFATEGTSDLIHKTVINDGTEEELYRKIKAALAEL